jgi:hypothetical protein
VGLVELVAVHQLASSSLSQQLKLDGQRLLLQRVGLVEVGASGALVAQEGWVVNAVTTGQVIVLVAASVNR